MGDGAIGGRFTTDRDNYQPATFQRVSNAVWTVCGTASDNAGLCAARVRVNTNEWTTAHGTTTWHLDQRLEPGTNVIWAYAVDAYGNESLTGSVKVIYVVSDLMVVQTDGSGSITPNYHAQWLEIGRRCSMYAQGVNGFTSRIGATSTGW